MLNMWGTVNDNRELKNMFKNQWAFFSIVYLEVDERFWKREDFTPLLALEPLLNRVEYCRTNDKRVSCTLSLSPRSLRFEEDVLNLCSLQNFNMVLLVQNGSEWTISFQSVALQ